MTDKELYRYLQRIKFILNDSKGTKEENKKAIYNLKDQLESLKINCNIYFFEYIKKRYVKICSKSGDYHFNEKIGNIDIDMASYNFFMPHQSFVVNLKYVKSISKNAITLENGESVPISRNKYKEVNNYYINYLCEMQ